MEMLELTMPIYTATVSQEFQKFILGSRISSAFQPSLFSIISHASVRAILADEHNLMGNNGLAKRIILIIIVLTNGRPSCMIISI